MHRPPLGPHGQPGFEIVSHQHPQQRPVGLTVLVGSRRVAWARLFAVGQPHRRSIDERSPQPEGGQGSVQMGGQLFEDPVAALFHHRRRQRLSCLIVSSGVTGQRLAALASVLQPFAWPRPEAGRQAAQQLQDHGLQRGHALQPPRNDQPHHDQAGVDAIVPADSGLVLRMFQQRGGQQPLVQGKRVGFPGPFRFGSRWA